MFRQLTYPLILSLFVYGAVIRGVTSFAPSPATMPEIQTEPEIELEFAKVKQVEVAPPELKKPQIKRPMKVEKKTIPVKETPKLKPATSKLRPRPVQRKTKPKDSEKQKAPSADYKQVLLSRLTPFKRYPRLARKKKIQGEALLRVKISREGKILFSKLSSKTGSSLLDRATMRMLDRVKSFPKMPEELKGNSYEFFVPVVFRIE